MNIAVLTLTRDRLDYTKHCFNSLEELAGCDYTHFVLDQGSTDGTREWLESDPLLEVCALNENVGICRGLNLMLDEMCNPERYDVIVRFDNDCELTQPDTLLRICDLADEYEVIAAPRVLGLNNAPARIATFSLGGDYLFDEVHHLGGIFMAIPSSLFFEHGYRYDERHPLATGDEAICPWWRSRGGHCGYIRAFEVNHYETTEGQKARYPDYEARKLAEMAA